MSYKNTIVKYKSEFPIGIMYHYILKLQNVLKKMEYLIEDISNICAYLIFFSKL